MSTPAFSELLKLSEAERLDLIQALWDSISPATEELDPDDEQIAELRRRVAEHDADPSIAVPWEEARARLRSRFGA